MNRIWAMEVRTARRPASEVRRPNACHVYRHGATRKSKYPYRIHRRRTYAIRTHKNRIRCTCIWRALTIIERMQQPRPQLAPSPALPAVAQPLRLPLLTHECIETIATCKCSRACQTWTKACRREQAKKWANEISRRRLSDSVWKRRRPKRWPSSSVCS